MFDAYIHVLIEYGRNVEWSIHELIAADDDDPAKAEGRIKAATQELKKLSAEFVKFAQRGGLSAQFAAHGERFSDRCEEHLREGLGGVGLIALARDFQQALVAELQQHHFILIAPRHSKYFNHHTPLFGKAVADEFPAAAFDIKEAGKCMALDRWSACIFHLMRAVEHALFRMARQLRLKSGKRPLDRTNMNEIIERVESELERRRRLPGKKTKTIRAREDFWSKAAVQFRYFKDAWRNHTSHHRPDNAYTEDDAETVWTAVKNLFIQLSKPLP